MALFVMPDESIPTSRSYLIEDELEWQNAAGEGGAA
jgi:hypothetical protein